MRNPFPYGTMDAVEFDEEIGEYKRLADQERDPNETDEALRAAMASDALRWHEEHARRADAPKPQACHACTYPYAGVSCPICKEERPAYAALKAASRRSTPEAA